MNEAETKWKHYRNFNVVEFHHRHFFLSRRILLTKPVYLVKINRNFPLSSKNADLQHRVFPIYSIITFYLQENQSSSLFRRKAFVMTDTELKVMATAAIMGLRSSPKAG